MSSWTKQYLTALLVSGSVTINPAVAQAGSMSQIGTVGMSRAPQPSRNGPDCRQSGRSGGSPTIRPSTINNNIQVYSPVNVNNDVNVYKPISIDNNINVYKPVTIDNTVSVTKNIDASKNITVNKPISITNNIDNSKNIDITNNINASKNIDASKSININKNININNGGSAADATAIAAAIAEASASSSASASVNFYGANSANSSSASSTFNGTSIAPETPMPSFGGDLGNISVEIAATAPTRQCTLQESTVVKAIHASCISDDKHEFPASHMVPDTWINSSYEGEIARCLPGSHLKVIVGKVMQSSEGMATGYSAGQILECAAHEALRHFKDGLLQCAPSTPVPDCTERTNLRKFGTGDMFFTYRAKICLETHEEYPETSDNGASFRKTNQHEAISTY